ncbi:hypothetical protein TSAR_010461, partial [Trichomalopsis sarcophagae]
VTVSFSPPGKLPIVMALLNKYEPNNTRIFRITKQGADNATVRHNYYDLSRRVDQVANRKETAEPANNLVTSSSTDDSDNTDNSGSTSNADDSDSNGQTTRTTTTRLFQTMRLTTIMKTMARKISQRTVTMTIETLTSLK